MSLKLSTARNLMVFMTDSSDHVSGKTGLTLTITASKDGAAFASITPTVTEVSNGWYSLALTTAHTGTLGDFVLHVTGTGADPTDVKEQVVTSLPGDAVTISAGTGTGQLDFTSGVVKVNLVQILGTALTETSGQIAAAFKKWFDVGTPSGTVNSIPNAVAGAAGGLFIAGTNAATTITTALTTTFTGNLTGSVASVTAGVTLAAAAVQAVWDALTSALTTTGSIGKLLVTNITGDAFARLGAPAGASHAADIAAVKTDTAAIKTKTDNLPASPAATSDIPSANIAAIKTKTDNLPAAPASEGNVTAVGSAVVSVASQIGAPVGASISADIATKLPTSTYVAPHNTQIDAIKVVTDQIGFTGSNVNANAQVVSDKTGYVLQSGQLTIKKNQALNSFEFLMTDSTSHDPATGLTVSVFRSIDGGAFVATTNSPTEVSGGVYKINLAAADLNGTVVMLKFSAAGADPRFVTIVTQA